ncbi:MAG: putative toxin-antitoxin system toxin component, PIN family, partial [Nitrospirae bacterium GWC2_46_6]
ISAFAFGGVPEKAVKKTSAEGDVFVSANLLNEYRNVPLELEAAGKITHLQLETLITGIAAFVVNAKIVFPRTRLKLCRDAKDNMVLECCLEANAAVLITGDKDLLDLTDIPFGLKILTPKEYLAHGE